RGAGGMRQHRRRRGSRQKCSAGSHVKPPGLVRKVYNGICSPGDYVSERIVVRGVQKPLGHCPFAEESLICDRLVAHLGSALFGCSIKAFAQPTRIAADLFYFFGTATSSRFSAPAASSNAEFLSLGGPQRCAKDHDGTRTGAICSTWEPRR